MPDANGESSGRRLMTEEERLRHVPPPGRRTVARKGQYCRICNLYARQVVTWFALARIIGLRFTRIIIELKFTRIIIGLRFTRIINHHRILRFTHSAVRGRHSQFEKSPQLKLRHFS
jgi:hypothetical protein